MTAFARAVLFVSAFLPVLPLVAVRTWEANRTLALGSLVASVVIGILASGVIYALGRGTVRRVRVVSTESRAESIVGFIVGYLLPASLIDGRDISVVIVNVAAFFFLVIVAVRAHLVYLNPLLALAGLHVYGVEVEDVSGGGRTHRTLIVDDPLLRAGQLVDVFGATGSLERAKVVRSA